MQQTLGTAAAQENGTGDIAGAATRAAAANNLGATDGALSLGLTGERRPPYRLQKSDVLDVSFTFTPEFNQSIAVQPDGYVVLRSVGNLYAEGQTLPQFTEAVRQSYVVFLHDPEVTITLKEFQKPYFIAGGEVTHPGKYELRSDTSISEAIAISGGFTANARRSQVLLFRSGAGGWEKPRIIDINQLLTHGRLGEDLRLRSGDFIFTPQNTFSKVRKYLPPFNTGMYINPTQY